MVTVAFFTVVSMTQIYPRKAGEKARQAADQRRVSS